MGSRGGLHRIVSALKHAGAKTLVFRPGPFDSLQQNGHRAGCQNRIRTPISNRWARSPVFTSMAPWAFRPSNSKSLAV